MPPPKRVNVAMVNGIGTTWQIDLVLEEPDYYYDIWVATGPAALAKGRMPNTPEGFGSALNFVAAEVAGELRDEFAEIEREKERAKLNPPRPPLSYPRSTTGIQR